MQRGLPVAVAVDNALNLESLRLTAARWPRNAQPGCCCKKQLVSTRELPELSHNASTGACDSSRLHRLRYWILHRFAEDLCSISGR
jgi:hypothetical protein